LRHPYDDDPRSLSGFRGHHYDPDQPRVPRGHPDGGQWTSDRELPLSDIAALPAPDLRRDDPHTGPRTQYALVRTGDVPIRVPNAPARAPIKPPIKPPIVPNPLISALRVVAPIGVAWQLFELLSAYNRPDQRVILGLQAKEFRRLRPDSEVFGFVRRLSQEETKVHCPSLKDVQDLVDEAAKTLGPRNPYRNSSEDAAYGKALEIEINKLLPQLNEKRARDSKPPLEWQKRFGPGGELEINKNELGVKVPDLTGKEKDKTACFYQVTSGDPSSVGLGMRMLVENFSKSTYATGTDIAIVTQVKPSPLPMPPMPRRKRYY
jgi:hypothetical protein